ncbi:hypothetical protein RD00_01710 [Pseudomonas amygdali pv. tabaci]|nr:hypothetical protein RD00_01710 [Pseudomonas amygdali pv. tabaci]
MTDEGGKPKLSRIATMFNSQLKKTNKALERRLAMLEQAGQILNLETVAAVLDGAGKVQSVNALFETELSYAQAEIAGRSLSELSPPELSADVHQKRALAAIRDGKHFSGTLRLVSKTGARVWLRTVVVPFKNETGGVLRDLNRQEGKTIVMVLHDLNLACRYADHMVAVHERTAFAQGRPADILSEALVKQVFGLNCRIIADPFFGTPLCIPFGRELPQ